ncbi:unnamed protein product, partial [Polarella glacialis]
GAEVPCCAGSEKCLKDWHADYNFYYKCLTSCSATETKPVKVQSSQKKAAESSQKKEVDCGDSWGSFAVSCSACPHGRDGCDGGDCFWAEQVDGQGTCVAKSSQKKAA